MVTMFWLVVGGMMATAIENYFPLPKLYLRTVVLIFAVVMVSHAIATRSHEVAINPIQLPTVNEISQSFSDFVEKMKLRRSSLRHMRGLTGYTHFMGPEVRVNTLNDFSHGSLNTVLALDLPEEQIEDLAIEMTSMPTIEAIFLHGSRSGLALLKRTEFPDPKHIISYNVGQFWRI